MFNIAKLAPSLCFDSIVDDGQDPRTSILILYVDGFDGSRNVGALIFLTYFVLYSWL